MSAIAVMGARSASADTASDDKVLAEILFREGVQLLNQQGKAEEACPKLAESERLDPASGTLIRLAECYQAVGKTASAWASYDEAAVMAERDKRADRARLARQRKAALELQLSRLTVELDPATVVEGIELKRDGVVIARAAFGVAVPIDPGKLRLEVSAPTYKSIVIEVDMTGSGTQQTVHVPPLEKEPPPPKVEPERSLRPKSVAVVRPLPERPKATLSSRQVAGIVLNSVGLSALGAGILLGVRAAEIGKDANTICPNASCSNGVTYSAYSAKASSANNVVIGAGFSVVGGIAGIIAGTLVFVVPSKDSARAPRSARGSIAPYATANGRETTAGVGGMF